MQVEWEATLNDMADLTFLQIAHSPLMARQHRVGQFVSGLLVALIIGVLYYLLFSLFIPVFPNSMWIIIIVASLIIGALSSMQYRANIRKKLLKIYREMYGTEPIRVSVELTPEGVITSQPGSHIMFGWKDIDGIEEDEKRIIFFTRQGGISIVRKRAFESEDLNDSFLNTAYALWKKKRVGDENELLES